MKQELIDKTTLFSNMPLEYRFAVTYREYYKEDRIDFNYPNGINPNPQMVECEHADFYKDLIEAKIRLAQLGKIEKYHCPRIYRRLNNTNSALSSLQ